MGNSHFKSDIKPVGDTRTIRGFATISASALTSAALTGTTSITVGDTVLTTGQIQLAEHVYLFSGGENKEATIVAVATAVDASVQGSLYLSTEGATWTYDTDTSATKLNTT